MTLPASTCKVVDILLWSCCGYLAVILPWSTLLLARAGVIALPSAAGGTGSAICRAAAEAGAR